MDRSTLMRLRALGDPTVAVNPAAGGLTLRDYQRAVQAALAASRGCAPRPILEAVTAAVITAIHQPHDKTQNPSPDARAAASTDG